MRKLLLSVVLITFIYMTQAANPFFGKYKTPHETTPFNKKEKEAGTKVLASQSSLDCRARRSG